MTTSLNSTLKLNTLFSILWRFNIFALFSEVLLFCLAVDSLPHSHEARPEVDFAYGDDLFGIGGLESNSRIQLPQNVLESSPLDTPREFYPSHHILNAIRELEGRVNSLFDISYPPPENFLVPTENLNIPERNRRFRSFLSENVDIEENVAYIPDFFSSSSSSVGGDGSWSEASRETRQVPTSCEESVGPSDSADTVNLADLRIQVSALGNRRRSLQTRTTYEKGERAERLKEKSFLNPNSREDEEADEAAAMLGMSNVMWDWGTWWADANSVGKDIRACGNSTLIIFVAYRNGTF